MQSICLSPADLGVTHPLDMLTPQEITAARQILIDAGKVSAGTRFPRVLPVEPDKQFLSQYTAGQNDYDRSVKVTLLEPSTGEAAEAVVSVTSGTVTEYNALLTGGHPFGQPQYLFEEYEQAEKIAKADPRWQAAMARRGITDTTHTFLSPLAPGFFPREGETGRRMIRSLTFHRNFEGDNAWAHPVEGLICHTDLTAGVVTRVEDDYEHSEPVPIPMENRLYDPEHIGPARTTLKPLEITQPEGPSFHVDGTHVTWENWKLRIGFNAQDGLVLNQVSFRDGEEDRMVLHRASVPEMVVPYGDTSNTRYWISYFDAGEYLLGKNANSLKLGCDCLGVIEYFDAFVAGDHGEPVKIPNAVCMHEEDYGVLWKHSEFGETPQVRRSRRLVISYFATIGNYDYGFFWYFYLDGSIQMEAKATGIVYAGGCFPGHPNKHAPEVAPGVIAPVHQHIFCARLDVAVDGDANTVQEQNVLGIPMGPENPHGNAFTWERETLSKELDAVRDANPESGRSWFVTNPNRLNYIGKPTSYQLLPMPGPRLMAQEGSSAWKRAQFATHHVWVTKNDESERFPAGDYPNQHAGDGIGEWVKQNRDIENTDIVLWHSFGPTHIPRTEDWPVMPVDYSGFWFKPYGFLDENPAMDLPDWSSRPAVLEESNGTAAAGGECCH